MMIAFLKQDYANLHCDTDQKYAPKTSTDFFLNFLCEYGTAKSTSKKPISKCDLEKEHYYCTNYVSRKSCQF